MATRSPSNKKVTNRNTNVPPPARNYADNTQAVRRMPGVTNGEQDKLSEQQKIAPLPKVTTPRGQGPMRGQRGSESLFDSTRFGNEPMTSGLPIGPGQGPAVSQQKAVNDLLYQMYAMTGDFSLLELVDFE